MCGFQSGELTLLFKEVCRLVQVWFNFLPQPNLHQQHSSHDSLSQSQFLVWLLVLQSLGFLTWI